MVPFGYICYATNYALFAFDMVDWLALHWHKNTDPFALLYSVINTWRLGVPIAYNFIQIFDIQSCAFLNVMGPVQQIPFVGKDLNDYVFPMALVAISLFTLLDLYKYCLKCFKRQVYNPKSYETQEKIKEGMFLVEKHRKERHIVVDYTTIMERESVWTIDSSKLNLSDYNDGSINSAQKK